MQAQGGDPPIAPMDSGAQAWNTLSGARRGSSPG